MRRRRHQKEAIAAIKKGFKNHNRGKFISACGSGKTLSSMWLAQDLEVKLLVVLVPSLSLLEQIYWDYYPHFTEDVEFLPVCSDTTVGQKNAEDRLSDDSPLHTLATTDVGVVTTFLRKRGQRVIFCTYHSSHVLQQAYKKARNIPKIDLMLFDEAHRCTGRMDSPFTIPLLDKNIPAKRRLFMTATPRLYAAGSGDFEIASMDDEELYGPAFYELYFAEAISRGLLTDFKVAVIGVSSSEWEHLLQRTTEQSIEGFPTMKPHDLATQIAVSKAIVKYKLKKTVAYFSSVQRASDFADTLAIVSRKVGARKQLKCAHVSGYMKTGERNEIMDDFRAAKRSAVMANAKCLSEGVDIPTLDSTVIADVRNSTIDLVQIMGRVMRLSDDKDVSVVVIPVVIPDDEEDTETILASSEFAKVWKVINALEAHDSRLMEDLSRVRQSWVTSSDDEGSEGVKPGKVPPCIDVDFSSVNLAEGFAKAFDTRLVEKTTSAWDAMYDRIVAVVEREGLPAVDIPRAFSGIYFTRKERYWLALMLRQAHQDSAGFKRLSAEKQAKISALPGLVPGNALQGRKTFIKWVVPQALDAAGCFLCTSYAASSYRGKEARLSSALYVLMRANHECVSDDLKELRAWVSQNYQLKTTKRMDVLPGASRADKVRRLEEWLRGVVVKNRRVHRRPSDIKVIFNYLAHAIKEGDAEPDVVVRFERVREGYAAKRQVTSEVVDLAAKYAELEADGVLMSAWKSFSPKLHALLQQSRNKHHSGALGKYLKEYLDANMPKWKLDMREVFRNDMIEVTIAYFRAYPDNVPPKGFSYAHKGRSVSVIVCLKTLIGAAPRIRTGSADEWRIAEFKRRYMS